MTRKEHTTMTKFEAIKSLIQLVATSDNAVDHLETLYDVVEAMCSEESKAELGLLIFNLIQLQEHRS